MIAKSAALYICSLKNNEGKQDCSIGYVLEPVYVALSYGTDS